LKEGEIDENEDRRYIVLDILSHNPRVANNVISMVYSIRCSSFEILQQTFALLTRVAKYSEQGVLVPDDITVKMNHSPVSNLWKLAREIDSTYELLDVQIRTESPEPAQPDDIFDKVYNHTTIYRGGY
jgi:hypothetical protein